MGDPSGYKDLKNEETNIGINTAQTIVLGKGKEKRKKNGEKHQVECAGGL